MSEKPNEMDSRILDRIIDALNDASLVRMELEGLSLVVTDTDVMNSIHTAHGLSELLEESLFTARHQHRKWMARRSDHE